VNERLLGMFRETKVALAAVAGMQVLILIAILLANQICNVGATALFAASGHAEKLRTFVFFQIIGGVFGLGIQLTFAGLVRYWSLTAANALGIGLSFVSAQVFAAYLIFHESFRWPQWFGTTLVFAGILLIALRGS
jgi:drug/metabolite transporter (DMT)-like permease